MLPPNFPHLDKKIDFYPGAHGNFLEMLLNVFAQDGGIDLSKPLFDANGACHLKYDWNTQPGYRQKIGCHHYSIMDLGFEPNDRVIEIVVDDAHKITVLINSDLRAGDQTVDIFNPEIDTLEKFRDIPKRQAWIDLLIRDYGHRKDYPRAAFRHLYHGQYGSDFNRFSHTGPKMSFPHSCFFDLALLVPQLERAAEFFGWRFQADDRLPRIWQEFMDLNQGLRLKNRCDGLLENLRQGRPVDLGGLTVLEEAWLIYRVFPREQDAKRYFKEFDQIVSVVAFR